MFRCQTCDRVSQSYEQPIKVVSKKREKEYPQRLVNNRKKKYEELPNGKLQLIEQVDPGGFGWERVQELTVCSTCAPSITAEVVQRVEYRRVEVSEDERFD
jgi:hypothetical protein